MQAMNPSLPFKTSDGRRFKWKSAPNGSLDCFINLVVYPTCKLRLMGYTKSVAYTSRLFPRCKTNLPFFLGVGGRH